MSVAASIAGAACLAVDSRAEVCRAALRAGACDFVVNSADEALRILKNEIRKRKPVSVAVAMAEDAALAELAERGVAPDVVPSSAEGDPFAARFIELGARVIGAEESTGQVREYAAARGLSLHEFRFASGEELRTFDQRLASATAEDNPRRRWALVAPGFFYREQPHRRVAYLTSDEAAQVG